MKRKQEKVIPIIKTPDNFFREDCIMVEKEMNGGRKEPNKSEDNRAKDRSEYYLS